MSRTITLSTDDVYFPCHLDGRDKPTTAVFREDIAAAILLADGVLFTNTSNDDDPTLCCYINCNDIFAPAADAESVEECELETLWRCYDEDPSWGYALWVLLRRQMLPWDRVLEKLKTPKLGADLSQWEMWDIDDIILTGDWMAAYVQKKGWKLTEGQLTYGYSRARIEEEHGPTLEQEEK